MQGQGILKKNRNFMMVTEGCMVKTDYSHKVGVEERIDDVIFVLLRPLAAEFNSSPLHINGKKTESSLTYEILQQNLLLTNTKP
jgi:hypothetical protein